MDNVGSLLYFLFNFFLYGFIGWIIENLYSYYKEGHFQEDGFLNGPFKPMYAIAMSIIIEVSRFIDSNNIFALLLLCLVVPTVVEYITGILMKVYFNKVYWDYSDYKYNSRGIVCLKFSIYWTILTFIGVRYFQVYIVDSLYSLIIPYWPILVIILLATLFVDEVLTIKFLRGNKDIVER